MLRANLEPGDWKPPSASMIHAADRLLASGHEIFSNGVQQASRLLRKRTTSLIHSEKRMFQHLNPYLSQSFT